jgi:hypothetical protein
MTAQPEYQRFGVGARGPPGILAANGRGWTQVLETVDDSAPLDLEVLEVDEHAGWRPEAVK